MENMTKKYPTNFIFLLICSKYGLKVLTCGVAFTILNERFEYIFIYFVIT